MIAMYESYSREELVSKIVQLETHVHQLKNIIAKSKKTHEKTNAKQRPFDFSKHNTRHVALKIAYLGWDYQGFAVQEDTNKTIESALFDALLKTRLIESRVTSNYHRCGRTDKGVSAFSQVVSLDLRTNLASGIGVKPRNSDIDTGDNEPSSQADEIRYVHILNRVLPPEIRVIAWCPVDPSFSARFSCTSRTYKYFFPRGNLQLDLMRDAARLLVGEHDFRNLCKMDVGNGVVNYKRRITAVELQRMTAAGDEDDGYDMYELTIVGQAFLWHQIRCIVSILFLVGQQLEKASIVSELLDTDRHPRKPQYTMASEFPLVLFNCCYDNCDVTWQHDVDRIDDVIGVLQTQWTLGAVRQAMLRRMLEELTKENPGVREQADCLVAGNRTRVYKPLFERELCESLEDRVRHYAKKRQRLT